MYPFALRGLVQSRVRALAMDRRYNTAAPLPAVRQSPQLHVAPKGRRNHPAATRRDTLSANRLEHFRHARFRMRERDDVFGIIDVDRADVWITLRQQLLQVRHL